VTLYVVTQRGSALKTIAASLFLHSVTCGPHQSGPPFNLQHQPSTSRLIPLRLLGHGRRSEARAGKGVRACGPWGASVHAIEFDMSRNIGWDGCGVRCNISMGSGRLRRRKTRAWRRGEGGAAPTGLGRAPQLQRTLCLRVEPAREAQGR